MKNGKIFLAGVLISFFGALPLGTLNVVALQILMNSGEMNSLYFVAGCIMVEVVYVRISLIAMDKVIRHEILIRMMNWISLLFMIILALSSIMSSVNQGGGDARVLFSTSMPPFVLGFLLMAVNVMLLPFWFGWNTILYIKKILVPENSCYNMYISGIAIGSFAGNLVFMFFGRFAIMYLDSNQYTINGLIGAILSLTAVIHYLKIRSRTDVAEEGM